MKPIKRNRGKDEMEELSSSSSEELKQDSKLSNKHLKTCSIMTNTLLATQEDKLKQSSIRLEDGEHYGTSSVQMKSLMKSFSNGNFQFYENLHKKYFDKAKDKS